MIRAHDNVIAAFHPPPCDDDDDEWASRWQTPPLAADVRTLISTPAVAGTAAAANDCKNNGSGKQQQRRRAPQLVACLTTNDEVHLLRASDGNIIASRSLPAPPPPPSTVAPTNNANDDDDDANDAGYGGARLFFLTQRRQRQIVIDDNNDKENTNDKEESNDDNNNNNDDDGDVHYLIIVSPPTTSVVSDGEHQQQRQQQQQRMQINNNVIIIGNMDASLLDYSSSSSTTSATMVAANDKITDEEENEEEEEEEENTTTTTTTNNDNSKEEEDKVKEGLSRMTINVLPMPPSSLLFNNNNNNDYTTTTTTNSSGSSSSTNNHSNSSSSKRSMNNITWMDGYFITFTTIRFIVSLRSSSSSSNNNNCSNGNSNNSSNGSIRNNNEEEVMMVWDYNTLDRTTTMVTYNLIDELLLTDDDDDDDASDDDDNMTMAMVGVGMDGKYLLVKLIMTTTTTTTTGGCGGVSTNLDNSSNTAPTTTTMSLLWINMNTLGVASIYNFPSNVVITVSSSIIPLRPPPPLSASYDHLDDNDNNIDVVAVAVYCQTIVHGNSQNEIRVIQSIISSSSSATTVCNHRYNNNNNAELLFVINMTARIHDEICPSSAMNVVEQTSASSSRVISLTPINGSNAPYYAFRCLVVGGGGENITCYEFMPDDEMILIGTTVHAKLVRHDYDEANAILMERQQQQQQQQQQSNMMTTLPTTSSDGTSRGRPYTPITTSYILRKQFQHILSSYITTTTASATMKYDSNDNDDVIASSTAAAAKECIRRIANAIVITGGKSEGEVECMCNTARFLLSWPMILTTNKTRTNNTPSSNECITVVNVRAALSAMSIAMAGVVNVIFSDDGPTTKNKNGSSSSSSSNEQVMALREYRHTLDERCTALKVLTIILPSLIDVKVSINDPYLAVSSIQELLFLLVERGAFKLVQKLLRTTIKVNMLPRGSSSSSSSSSTRMVSSLLHPDIIAMSVMRIPLTLHPLTFIPWLCDVVIPSLSFGSKILRQIHSWSVNAACYYDDEENNVSGSSRGGGGGGIDASVMLLSAVNDATSRLAVEMNSNNFIYHSRHQRADQDVTDDDNNDLSTPRNNNHDGSFSFKSTASRKLRSSSSSRPTVLNIGLISGAKNTSGSRMMSAQRIGRGGNGNSLDYSFLNKLSLSHDSNIETSYVNENDDDDDESLDYDCVEYKLNEAIRLKKARDLGLSQTVLRLTTYSIKGEQYIMKELIKSALLHHYSEDSCDGTTLAASFIVVDQMRSFAVTLDANFDEAVRQYVTELCDNNRDDIPQALRQTRILFHWCNSPAIKCDIVLRMLRVAIVSVQRPPNITLLAKDAIAMAVNENDKCELQEALKLLEIDSLVRKYCGNGAQEYFRVVSV